MRLLILSAIGAGLTLALLDADGGCTRPVASLPSLPPNTAMATFGHPALPQLEGTIVVAGPLSLDPADPYYSYSKIFRRTHELFAAWFNHERRGVVVRGRRYGVRFQWVGDGSSAEQVGNATSQSLRLGCADFAISSYSSGLTMAAARRSYAEGYLMMSAGAAATAVFTQNEWTFGLYPPAARYAEVGLAAIRHAAGAAPSGSCAAGCLRVAFVQADTLFTRAQCAGAPAAAAAAGLLLHAPTATVRREPDDAALDALLGGYAAAGVQVLVGCTYFSTALAIIAALERLDWAPHAVVLSEAVGTNVYTKRIGEGWWQGEYVLGQATWHKSLPWRGQFSGWTSQQFYERYAAAYDGFEVSYHGAANFAALCALMESIERAQSFDAGAVKTALEAADFVDFYGPIRFDAHHQIDLPMLLLQARRSRLQAVREGQLEEDVVFPLTAVRTAPLAFPMPPWAQRRCRLFGPQFASNLSAGRHPAIGRLSLECHGHGKCTAAGECACDDGWLGAACSVPRGLRCDAGAEPSDESSDDFTCEPCPVGKFKAAASNARCSSCPYASTTLRTGSKSYADCVCQEGFFRPNKTSPASSCAPCPSLALCRLDTVVASLEMRAGAWRLSNQTTRVYRCASTAAHHACSCIGHNYGVAAERNFSEPWGANTYGSTCDHAWDAPEAACAHAAAAWCEQKWCYVTDPSCPGARPTDFFKGTRYEEYLWFSYEQCGGNDTFGVTPRSAFASPCAGGAAAGEEGEGYCAAGHTGPKCEACTQDGLYYHAASLKCEACPTPGVAVGLSVAVGLGLTALLGLPSRAVHLRPIRRLTRLAAALHRGAALFSKLGWLAKLKVTVTSFQIWSGCPSLYGVTIPKELAEWFNIFSFLSLDFDDIYPAQCLGDLASRLWLSALFPFMLVGLILVCSAAWALFDVYPRVRGAALLSRTLLLALPPMLLVIFIFLPPVSRVLFETWLCERYDYSPSVYYLYLKASPAIRCYGAAHDRVAAVAMGLIVLWPLAMPALFACLLWHCREAIRAERPNKLSIAVGVLHREYRTRVFWWELVELFRRLLLNGTLVLLIRDELASMRLVFANFICFTYLMLLLTVKPYLRHDDNALAAAAAFVICCTFLCALLIKLVTDGREAYGADFGAVVGVGDPLSTAAIMLALGVVQLALVSLTLGVKAVNVARIEAEAQREHEENVRARGRMAHPPTTRWQLHPSKRFCLFLSHYKEEAGSDARYLRDLIQKMVAAPAYLDSADLLDLRSLFDDGVHQSEVLLVLATRSYLTRAWCLLEIWEAWREGIPVLVLPIAGRGYEPDDAVRLIENLETELEARNPGALKDVRRHLQQQDVCDLAGLKEALLTSMGLRRPLEHDSGRDYSHRARWMVSRHSNGLFRRGSAARSSIQSADAREVVQPLVWRPWSADHQILLTMRKLLDESALLAGKTLEWTDPSAHRSRRLTSHVTWRGKGEPAKQQQLLILYDRRDAAASSAALVLAEELQKHLGERDWRVMLGRASETTLSLEVSDSTVVLLLQTSCVLHGSGTLLQLYEAILQQVPILCVILARGGYDFIKARSHLASLADSLEAKQLASLRRLLLDRDIRLPAVSLALEDTLPKIISFPFEPLGGDADLEAFLQCFSDRLSLVMSKSQVERANRLLSFGSSKSTAPEPHEPHGRSSKWGPKDPLHMGVLVDPSNLDNETHDLNLNRSQRLSRWRALRLRVQEASWSSLRVLSSKSSTPLEKSGEAGLSLRHGRNSATCAMKI
ncbi:hypothetical protein AB1Y20_003366 [Prymnesium parvum]|uniref:EGF-like domain-containing protein n=1 Tax=Prymnesium parvum TaxID=97485 RepID=A0AB34JBZ6_PRYPA